MERYVNPGNNMKFSFISRWFGLFSFPGGIFNKLDLSPRSVLSSPYLHSETSQTFSNVVRRTEWGNFESRLQQIALDFFYVFIILVYTFLLTSCQQTQIVRQYYLCEFWNAEIWIYIIDKVRIVQVLNSFS